MTDPEWNDEDEDAYQAEAARIWAANFLADLEANPDSPEDQLADSIEEGAKEKNQP